MHMVVHTWRKNYWFDDTQLYKDRAEFSNDWWLQKEKASLATTKSTRMKTFQNYIYSYHFSKRKKNTF